jgi:hypothetical protein
VEVEVDVEDMVLEPDELEDDELVDVELLLDLLALDDEDVLDVEADDVDSNSTPLGLEPPEQIVACPLGPKAKPTSSTNKSPVLTVCPEFAFTRVRVIAPAVAQFVPLRMAVWPALVKSA